MAGTFEIVSIPITVSDIYIASFTRGASGVSFGDTIARVAGPQQIAVDFSVASDSLFAGGELVDIFSIVRGLEGMNLKLAGMDRPAMALLTGKVNEDNNAPAGSRRGSSRQPAGGSGMPYVGLICVHPTSDDGLSVLCIAGAKVDKPTPMTMDGENPAYGGGTVPMKAISVETHTGQGSQVLIEQWFEDKSDFDAPTDGAEFLALFADVEQVPNPVTSFAVGTETSNSAPLSWTNPTTGTTADYIMIKWTEQGQELFGTAQIAATETSYTITGLDSSSSYDVEATRVNDSGESTAASAVATTT